MMGHICLCSKLKEALQWTWTGLLQ